MAGSRQLLDPPDVAPADGLVFDQEFLRKLERLEIVARKIARGRLRGEHTHRRRGKGLEITDFRRYQPGDDFRHIDWNILSRLDRLFVRLYAAEEDLTLHLLVDCSASMGFGRPAKFDYARRLAAALAHIGLHNLERVALAGFGDGLRASLPPLKSRRHMTTLLDFLLSLDCRDGTRLDTSLKEFAARASEPGLVVLISDLLTAGTRRGLAALRGRGHAVVAIQVLSEEEIDPPLDGALRLVDAEDGRELRVTVDAPLRAAYRAALGARLEALETHCRQSGIEYLRASTAVPFEDLVLKYLRRGTYLR